jgi:hypothetical protein
MKWLKVLLALTLLPISSHATEPAIRLERFEQPFCMIGHGNPDAPFQEKLTVLRRYQRRISRKSADFRRNRELERRATLHGSPKWVTYRFLAHREYTAEEIDFAFFAMTLFGEARNLSEESMEMVAKVINNRRRGKNYADTVTELAQFSAWYYRNQRDNVDLLCPPSVQTENWRRAVRVAARNFNRTDQQLGSTHYFSPYNMVPRFTPPAWARGKWAVSYGGHIFLIDPKTYKGEKTPVFLPRDLKRVRAVRGEIRL